VTDRVLAHYTQVAPFDVTVPYATEVARKPMATYIDWMRSCWYVTFMANPAISVPCGFTATGHGARRPNLPT
jgi:amidase